jgi:hypothetical protein
MCAGSFHETVPSFIHAQTLPDTALVAALFTSAFDARTMVSLSAGSRDGIRMVVLSLYPPVAVKERTMRMWQNTAVESDFRSVTSAFLVIQTMLLERIG